MLKLVRPVAVIDLETTGTSVELDRIVEIGILKIAPAGKQIRFQQRINPGIKIPKEASKIHGITNRDVARKPSFKETARRVLRLIKGCDLAGFNLKRFDIPLLQAEFKRAGLNFVSEGRSVLDVQEIYHLHEQRRLCDAVKFYCNSVHEEAHSAVGDADATWRVLQAQILRYGLPSSVKGLSGFMLRQRAKGFMDSGCWFVKRNGKAFFAKGKHRGKLLSQVVREDADYLGWICKQCDVPSDTKRMIGAAGRK